MGKMRSGIAFVLSGGDRAPDLAGKGISKACPVRILNGHEIVNDTVGEEPVVITGCPLAHRDRRYHPKEQVIAIVINGEARAGPFRERSRRADQDDLEDDAGGEAVRIQFDASRGTGRAWVALNPEPLDSRGPRQQTGRSDPPRNAVFCGKYRHF